jgi:hypothetical protein
MIEKPWMNLCLYCASTGKDEPQFLVKSDEDGVTLRCGGCGTIHSHEIGYFADLFETSPSRIKPNDVPHQLAKDVAK